MAISEKILKAPPSTGGGDLVPSSHFGTVIYQGTGATQSINGGKFDGAAGFNGSSSYIDWGSGGTAGINNNNITMSAWVNLTAYHPTTNHLSMIMTTQDDHYFYMGIVGASNNQGLTAGRVVMSNDQVVSGDPVSGYITESDTTISLNTWTHIAVTLSSSAGAKIYINGDLDKTQSGRTSNCNSASGKSYLGAYRSGGTTEYYLNGKIDQVRAYNSVLTDSEISDLSDETYVDSFNKNFPTGKTALMLYRLNGNANDEGDIFDATATNVTWKYGTNFTPDLVWIKRRSSVEPHALYDTIRGINKQLETDDTTAQATNSSSYPGLTSFDSGGFTVGNNGGTNNSSNTYVAWCWNAGGSSVTNNDGSHTSTVRANRDAGFSISTFQTISGNFSTGHGLSKAPELVITKLYDYDYGWETIFPDTFGQAAGSSTTSDWNRIFLNTNAFPTSNGYMAADATKIYNGAFGSPYPSFMYYAWHSVEGFSKIGSYTGNGSTSGPMVETGFEPAFLMIKKISGSPAYGGWHMWDNKRNPINPRNTALEANGDYADATADSRKFNFYSDGFQPLTAADEFNNNGVFIYLAIAADPKTVTPVLAKSFKISTYTGDKPNEKTITGLGFSPSLVWTKNRDTSDQHSLFDVVRGQYALESNTQNAQSDFQGYFNFNSDGFAVGNSGQINESGDDFVAWSWKAGNSTDILTTGTINSVTSINDEAGFSIAKYSGTGSAATVAHGLSAAPNFIIVKNISSGSTNFRVYHSSYPATKFLSLNNSDASADADVIWNDTAPTSTVFSIGTDSSVGSSGDSYIAYCWRAISGYSAFGSYTAGTTDGSGNQYINVGFQPDWVMIKRSSTTGNWSISDAVRSPGTPTYCLYRNIYADEPSAEGVATGACTNAYVEYTSTGFGWSSAMIAAGTNPNYYSAGHIHIYAAFKMN